MEGDRLKRGGRCMRDNKRIVLGMSGGVDSSVAVAVLQHEGYEVVGVTCIFQPGEGANSAVWESRLVCDRFGIEHVIHDCSDAFEQRVVRPFVDDYAAGLTPSPCVGCNASTKVLELLRVADDLGCAKVATGHYARIAQLQENGRYVVLCALDHAKDQSYMLSTCKQEQLSRLVLPLGGMTKLAVKSFACDLGLERLAEKPESQDICFAPHGYRELLTRFGVRCQPGSIVLNGKVVGEHTGLADYTVGQRKGIGVAGPEPYYVIGKDPRSNELRIGTLDDSRITRVVVKNMEWQALDRLSGSLDACVKLRYRSTACPCIITSQENDGVHVQLLSPQPSTAPGQYAVFYQGSTVLGGGVIEEVG